MIRIMLVIDDSIRKISELKFFSSLKIIQNYIKNSVTDIFFLSAENRLFNDVPTKQIFNPFFDILKNYLIFTIFL